MTPRTSPLRNFLLNALQNRIYPNLFWCDVASMIFCFKCVCKNKKEWRDDYGKVFEDYHNLRSRRNANDGSDKRQRLLVALKASSCVELMNECSTRDEKYYKLHLERRSSSDSSDGLDPHSSGGLSPHSSGGFSPQSSYLNELESSASSLEMDHENAEFSDSQATGYQDSPTLAIETGNNLSEDTLLLPTEEEIFECLKDFVDEQTSEKLECTIVNNDSVPDLESVQSCIKVDELLHLCDEDPLTLPSNSYYKPNYAPDFSDLCSESYNWGIPNDYDPWKDVQLSQQPQPPTANPQPVQNAYGCSKEMLTPLQSYTIAVPEGDAMNFLMNQSIRLDSSPKKYYLLVVPEPDSLNVSSTSADGVGLQDVNPDIIRSGTKPDSLNVCSAYPFEYGMQSNYF